MAERPTYDVYLSYNQRDADAVRDLDGYLSRNGLRVWRDETGLAPGVDWQNAMSKALADSAFFGFCVGPAGLGNGQMIELGLAEAHAANQPDLLYAAVLLPGLPNDFSAAALPASLAGRQWVDLRSGNAARDEWIKALRRSSTPPAESQPPSTPSVQSAARRLTGEVTAADFVREIVALHPEYGGGEGRRLQLALREGARATADSWLERVRALLATEAVTELHGRLVIVGLARLDRELRAQLEERAFLSAVEREIREPLPTLFRDDTALPEETVPTHTDNPALVDELNREGVARILAQRIRDAQTDEQSSAEAVGSQGRGRAFLVHIHGRWGVGKTTLLNFLRSELHKHEPTPWVVVTFNAWQHQRLAPPWWWLMSALTHEGFEELWGISRPRALSFRVREWFWRLRGGWPGLLMLLAAAGLVVFILRVGFVDSIRRDDLSFALAKGLIVGLAAVLAPVLTIWGVARAISRWILTTSARGARLYIQHARDPMETAKEHFAELIRWLGHPLAIVIDDLDRCKPAFAVELLEGIQTLFRDVPVTYIVAADREWLASSYAAEYEVFKETFDEAGRPLGYLFLEKTFQLTLAVPALSAATRDAYWRGLIRPAPIGDRSGLEDARREAGRAFKALQTEEEIRSELARHPGATPTEQRARLEAAAIQLASPRLEQAAEHVLHPFRPLLDSNPRAMKRLVNAYGLARGIELLAQQEIGSDKHAQHRTALWTILSVRWPRLAEYLAEHPEAASAVDGSGAGDGVPSALAHLFKRPEVVAVMKGQADGVRARLDSDSIRISVSA